MESYRWNLAETDEHVNASDDHATYAEVGKVTSDPSTGVRRNQGWRPGPSEQFRPRLHVNEAQR